MVQDFERQFPQKTWHATMQSTGLLPQLSTRPTPTQKRKRKRQRTNRIFQALSSSNAQDAARHILSTREGLRAYDNRRKMAELEETWANHALRRPTFWLPVDVTVSEHVLDLLPKP